MFIHSDIAYDSITYMNRDDLEGIWVDVPLLRAKPILVGACYRPPDQNNFYSILEDVCSNNNGFLNAEVIITGDLNTNVLKPGNNALVKAPRSFCSMFDVL
jgi:hypothetical protein